MLKNQWIFNDFWIWRWKCTFQDALNSNMMVGNCRRFNSLQHARISTAILAGTRLTVHRQPAGFTICIFIYRCIMISAVFWFKKENAMQTIVLHKQIAFQWELLSLMQWYVVFHLREHTYVQIFFLFSFILIIVNVHWRCGFTYLLNCFFEFAYFKENACFFEFQYFR